MSTGGEMSGIRQRRSSDLEQISWLRKKLAEQRKIMTANLAEIQVVREGLRHPGPPRGPTLSWLLHKVPNLVLRRAFFIQGRRPLFMQFFGVDAATMLGQAALPRISAADWYARVHPAHRWAYQRAEVEQVEHRGEYTLEYRYLDARSGEFRWARESVGAPTDLMPETWFVDSCILDVTEQKRLQDELQASEQSYRAVVEDQSEYIRRFDCEHRLTFVNRAFCRLMRRSRAQLLGVDLLTLLPAGAARQMRERLAALTVGRPAAGYELKVVSADGLVEWQEWTDRAIFDCEGQVREYQSVGRDITERKLADREARYLLQHDPLTDLPSRALLEAHLRQAVKQATRARHCAAVLLLDLDGFKRVNDTYGHLLGDRLLRAVAQRLRCSVRASDVVGRTGGDEFAVILPTIDGGSAAQALAHKLVEALARPFAIGGQQLPLAASSGIALFPDHAEDPLDLLHAADVALYRAKAEGRNTARLYVPAMGAMVSARRAIERDLRRAFRRRELELYYQPRLDLRSQRPAAIEALVRWRRSDHDLIMPEDFLEVADGIGLAQKLDRWVIDHACRQAVRWRAAGLEAKIAVNVSGRQASEPWLSRECERILRATGLPPDGLEIELTERAVIDAGSEATVDSLQRVADLGVHLAIDDFGSGFSSFAYLRRLPVHTIKIDRSFVAQIGIDRADETIIRSIIDLCHALGKRVVAEGVETNRQLAFLAAHGCDEVQGFLFCHPRPAPETENYLTRPWVLPPQRDAVRPEPVLRPGTVANL